MANEEKRFWFNVDTHEVEEGPESDWSKRLGPFSTREEASKALEIHQARNEKWDAEDKADKDWGFDN